MGLCYELTLKFENGPLFPLEIYIIIYNNGHHNDDFYIFKNEILVWCLQLNRYRFQTYNCLVADIIICNKIHHELALKIETCPLFPLEIYFLQFIIMVIIMMTHPYLKIEPLFGANSLLDIVFQTYDCLVAGIIICNQVYHELTLKIETGPLFPLEIYIPFYNNGHHNDDSFTFEK